MCTVQVGSLLRPLGLEVLPEARGVRGWGEAILATVSSLSSLVCTNSRTDARSRRETLPPFPPEIPLFSEKNSAIDFWVKIRFNNAFLPIFFRLNHVLLTKIVSLFPNSLACQNWKNIFPLLFRYLLFCKFDNNTAINFLCQKTNFPLLFEQNSGANRTQAGLWLAVQLEMCSCHGLVAL